MIGIRRMSEVLSTDGLTKSFSGFLAIDNVDFAIEHGELRALIGPNGAGKTTFFNLLSGTFSPTEGTIEVKGEDVTGKQPHQIVDHGIARSFQISNLFDGMTVMENLRLGVLSTRTDGFSLSFLASDIENDERVKSQAYEVARQVDLGDAADAEVSELSHGQKRKLEIGIALSLDPELLLLDEPAAGLTTDETMELVDTIRSVSDDRTILLIEHDMELVHDLADTISVLHHGELIAEGDPTDVRENSQVQNVYLGGE
ncbi:ABC transporter ATP-binding protein [Halopenitus persicus]|uniref:ABC transporter ATP-binding protein n=1 Tax=Halopenitus persicus TaxID=1048396 RepID=UPI001E5BC974|nr:ABC transporter ATP-binding protein [Halopenitus persicus]